MWHANRCQEPWFHTRGEDFRSPEPFSVSPSRADPPAHLVAQPDLGHVTFDPCRVFGVPREAAKAADQLPGGLPLLDGLLQ